LDLFFYFDEKMKRKFYEIILEKELDVKKVVVLT